MTDRSGPGAGPRPAPGHRPEQGSTAAAANPIEAHFGPLRTFVIAGSNYPNHTVATRALHEHLRWRNANPAAPDVLAAQGRE